MWICQNCSEEVEDQFGTCWNCEADMQGALPTKSSSDRDAEDMKRKAFLNEKFRSKHCLRCNIALRYAGRKEFHEGMLSVALVALEMYVCPNCLRVEFFVSDPSY